MADIGLIVSAIISGLFFILFILMIYQSVRKNRTAYVLTLSFLIGGIGGIASVLQYVITSASQYFLYSSLIIWSLVYFLIYIFFEELYTEKPNRFRFALMTILLFASILFNLLYLFAPTVSYLNLTGDLATKYTAFLDILQWSWDSSYNLLGLLIFVFGAFVHFHAYKYTREIITFIQAISMVIIGLGFIIGFVGGDIFQKTDFHDIADIVKIVGMLTFAIIYIIRIDFIYRLPVNVYFILVFTKIGLNVHISRMCVSSKKTNNESQSTGTLINENLLSSLITAISGLLNESLGSTKELKAIIAEDRTIVMDTGLYSTCAVLCDRPTHFLNKSLSNLRKSVEITYQEKLTESTIIKEDFKDISELIKKNFPFLLVEKNQKL